MMVLAKLLIKVFGNSFYRENSSFLLYSVIFLFGYGLFIKTAGHIYDADAHRYLGFSLLLAFIQAPVFSLAIYAIWVAYALKSWAFVWKESLDERQLFWRYSMTALPGGTQFMAWCLCQLYVFAPMLFYWLLTLCYAFVIGEFTTVGMATVGIIGLTVCGAALHVYRFNGYRFGRQGRNALVAWTRPWKKPLPLIYLLDLALNRKAGFLLVKGVSALLFAIQALYLADADRPESVACCMAATMVLAHAFLAFQDYRFFDRHLYFVRQLPWSNWTVFGSFSLSAFLLLIPELAGFLLFFYPAIAMTAFMILFSGVVLARTTGYLALGSPLAFIRHCFAWYAVAVVAALYEWPVPLILAQLTIAFVLHNRYYRRNETVGIK